MLPLEGSILEVGCGSGANFRYYPVSWHAISTEPSVEMMKLAVPKAGFNLLVRADAQYLPFPESAFDAAFGTLVFCSVPDPFLGFRELRRVVRTNGIVVLLEHVRPPGLLGPVFDAANVLSSALIDDRFNRRTADIAEQSGLQVMEIRRKAAGIVNLIVCKVIK
jgi:SAM-dependent methyltransferase